MSCLEKLEIIKRNNLAYTDDSINKASILGQIDILNWWKNSGLELKYSEDAINYASRAGSIESLEWWRKSGLFLKYSKDAMDNAFNAEILQWWKDSGLELKYSYKAIEKNKLTEWFLGSGLTIKRRFLNSS